ncbi:Dihydrolipoyllysine-residue acetyltransferase component of pyruvate dehydrogenase complex [Geodia barretti]|uniref:Dihydrolipoamide acetyltransferase component of pyruvate dehydrogenase complex n=1 Tax=Geodia barretti TaxID=519541 RepID=A0AA35W1S8_GEOBA|nr:Dihydrolipoyllysine-residue acetyltransferase component of pyruvate dehydrogenase complex [Geodia barretti]
MWRRFSPPSRKTGRLLITHEAVQRCGWGAEIAAMAAKDAFDYLDAPIERVCAKETPVPFSPKLESYVIPDKDDEQRFMATPLPMPKLGLTMEEGTILKWRKGEGEAVEKGEIILDIQTDKATVVPCGTDIAVIGETGEDISGFGGGGPAETPVEAEPGAADAPPAPPPAPAPPLFQRRPSPHSRRLRAAVFASPAARRVARELGIDSAPSQARGPGGRIVQADVRAAAASGLTAAHGRRERPRGRGRFHAPGRYAENHRRSHALSWSQVPRITMQAEVDLTNLLAVREAGRQAWENDLGVRVSINDLILFYTARAVRRCPAVNVRLAENALEQMRDVNIGVAVAVEQGLMVPVIRGADQKSIDAISRESRALAEAARAGALGLDALEGGTFTVSNLGAYGVDHFSAIINHPESAILSVGAARERAVVRNGEVVARTTVYVGINADHRLVDGAPAAEFLSTLKGHAGAPQGDARINNNPSSINILQ